MYMNTPQCMCSHALHPPPPLPPTEKPFEETLSQSTLWPETHKLYGHGNDLYAVAGDPRGALFVSSCRAQSSATAALWVWDVQR